MFVSKPLKRLAEEGGLGVNVSARHEGHDEHREANWAMHHVSPLAHEMTGEIEAFCCPRTTFCKRLL